MIAAYRAALRACDPEAAVQALVAHADGRLRIGDQAFDDVDARDVVVVGVGKAAASMARGLAAVVDVHRGVVVGDHDAECPVDLIVGDHPIPGARSLVAGRRLLDTVSRVLPTDVVVFLVSGGGSALAEDPMPGIDLDDLAVMNRVLTTSAVPITEINEVRAVTSRIKAGRLAEATGTGRVVTLVLSDVVAGAPMHVASGPTIGHGLGEGARGVIEHRGLGAALPRAVLDAAASVSHLEGPPGPWKVVGSPDIAALAAASFLRDQGYAVDVEDPPLDGVVEAAVERVLDHTPDGAVLVAAGEVVVRVDGVGIGGRNQHAALIAAERIAGTGMVFGAFATDGRDGPTDAAGAVVDGGTWARIADAGVDASAALADFDSGTALGAAGASIVVGPSGTNVADLWIVARQPSTLPRNVAIADS
jgi:hydroxypyruvate reductase